MKTILKLLAKRLLIPLGLTAATSAADAGIQKKIFGLGTTALVTLNEETEHFIKIVKSLDESGLQIKVVTEAVKNKTKEQKGGFLVCC